MLLYGDAVKIDCLTCMTGAQDRWTDSSKQTDTQKHRHTDTHTDRHIYTQTHRHTDTQTATDRHTDTQTHRHTDTHTNRVKNSFKYDSCYTVIK